MPHEPTGVLLLPAKPATSYRFNSMRMRGTIQSPYYGDIWRTTHEVRQPLYGLVSAVGNKVNQLSDDTTDEYLLVADASPRSGGSELFAY